MTDGDAPQKKTFSYDEALALLPEVRRLTDAAQQQVDGLGTAPTLGEGRPVEVTGRLEAIVTEWARTLNGMGLEVKGLWLVDFDNGSGYYCWRYPEEGLHYYHTYEEGFRGRMRIQ